MARDADIQRMVGDLVREGTVVSVNDASGTCRVQIGDIVSGDMPWTERAAGTTRTWCPPSVGEQVAIFSPEADLARGFVAGSLFSDAHGAPWDNADAKGIVFSDGAYISYDAGTGELHAVLPGSGKATIEAPGGIFLRGDVKVEGKLTADGDIVAGTVSLQKHLHDKVQAGGAISGKPVA